MNNRIFIAFYLFLSGILVAQKQDTLFVNYYVHVPFAYAEDGIVKGIEVDILNEYILWLKAKKKITITFQYKEFTDFSSFYNTTKKAAKNTIGLGSATINQERIKEVDFTNAYLKNVAFCITNGHAPDVKTKNPDEIIRSLGSMSALTLSNTTLSRYVNEIKKSYINDLQIRNVTDEVQILDEISKNVLVFGYVDAVGFWIYLKKNPQKFLKMQRILSQAKEEMGFLIPKGSQHKALFDEFFSGPGGLKSTPTYRAILEKYLGSYMAQNVAVN